jgi:sigma54-dependent transcription regulator
MGESALALDNILAASQFFVGKWTPTLKRNQSRDLLRHLLCRLHGASKGNLFEGFGKELCKISG